MDPQQPSSLVERDSMAHCLPHVTLDFGHHYLLWLNPECHCGVAASVALQDRTPGPSALGNRDGFVSDRLRQVVLAYVSAQGHFRSCLCWHLPTRIVQYPLGGEEHIQQLVILSFAAATWPGQTLGLFCQVAVLDVRHKED